MGPGEGRLELGGYLEGDIDSGQAGARARYEHRLGESWSLYGDGSVGYRWDPLGRGLEYKVGVGALWTF